jgi:hypothetical protein
MFYRLAGATALALLVTAGSAAAAGNNDISFSDPTSEYNTLALNVDGAHNVLTIAQAVPLAPSDGNIMDVSLTGDFNGGAGAFTGAALTSGLTPGLLSQDGAGNRMALAVIGSHNLFAMVQHGSSNVIEGHISGVGNQAAVVQNGVGNHFSFSQSGIGNIINISQTSW